MRTRSSNTSTRRKPCKQQRFGITQREYQAREDLLELHALLDSGLKPAQIARIMGKDPAWVSRSTRRLREDPALAFRSPVEGEIILQSLMRQETIYRQAMRGASECEGSAKASLLKVATSVTKQTIDYSFRVGILEHYSHHPSMDSVDDRIRMAHPDMKKLGQGADNAW